MLGVDAEVKRGEEFKVKYWQRWMKDHSSEKFACIGGKGLQVVLSKKVMCRVRVIVQ